MSNCTSTPFRWKQCIELGYADGPDSNDDMAEQLCFRCGKESSSLSTFPRCSKCQVVAYCSRDCQVANWKKGSGGGHKSMCSAYKRVGVDMIIALPDDKESARQDVFQRIRFFAAPYFVHKSKTIGKKGFLFIQSNSTLAEMSLPIPILANGHPMIKQRSVLLYFLTFNEYTQELCRDDFELTAVSAELHRSIEDYDPMKEFVVMMRFRCGHVAVGAVPLVPDYELSVKLGAQYYGGENAHSGALQLNLDDI